MLTSFSKHVAQHVKPNRCEDPQCRRSIDGFGTANDLQRHYASVHPALANPSALAGYICVKCEETWPGITRKWWPRKDNFKSHVQRKHLPKNTKDDELVERIIEE